MIATTTVTVMRPTTTTDRLNNRVRDGWATEQVDGVLVAPGATSELEAARPDGVTVAYTLHFPKGYAADLTGCTIHLLDPWRNKKGYRVIGSPRPYMDANTPTSWHMPVEVEVANG